MNGARSSFLAALSLLVLTSPVFGIEWYKAYDKGKEAIRNGDCAQGQSLMLEALRQNSKTGLKVPSYGTRREEYIPHYYLAQCAERDGDLAKAAQYLRAAESSGASSSSFATEFASTKSKVDAALKAQKQTEIPPIVTPKKDPVVSPPVQTSPQPAAVTVPPKEPTDAAVDKETTTRRLLKEASDDLEAGRLEEARKIVEGVLRRMPDRTDARLLLDEVSKRERIELQSREKSKRLNELEQLIRRGDLDSAEKTANSIRSIFGTDAHLDSLVREIEKKRELLLETQRQAELKRAVEKQVLSAYYRGDYSGAIELAGQWLQRNSGSWRLHFFVGCAYAALAMMEETERDSRLSLARGSFRKARSLTKQIAVPPYISPKILEIYRTS